MHACIKSAIINKILALHGDNRVVPSNTALHRGPGPSSPTEREDLGGTGLGIETHSQNLHCRMQTAAKV